ncbi:MAG: hypothetical protein JHC38_05430, partial [Thiotrichales bacterium]|jgi:hypothetical protein|nr:hypothetical protein [Thiotrichales bacterium]
MHSGIQNAALTYYPNNNQSVVYETRNRMIDFFENLLLNSKKESFKYKLQLNSEVFYQRHCLFKINPQKELRIYLEEFSSFKKIYSVLVVDFDLFKDAFFSLCEFNYSIKLFSHINKSISVLESVIYGEEIDYIKNIGDIIFILDKMIEIHFIAGNDAMLIYTSTYQDPIKLKKREEIRDQTKKICQRLYNIALLSIQVSKVLETDLVEYIDRLDKASYNLNLCFDSESDIPKEELAQFLVLIINKLGHEHALTAKYLLRIANYYHLECNEEIAELLTEKAIKTLEHELDNPLREYAIKREHHLPLYIEEYGLKQSYNPESDPEWLEQSHLDDIEQNQ